MLRTIASVPSLILSHPDVVVSADDQGKYTHHRADHGPTDVRCSSIPCFHLHAS